MKASMAAVLEGSARFALLHAEDLEVPVEYRKLAGWVP